MQAQLVTQSHVCMYIFAQKTRELRRPATGTPGALPTQPKSNFARYHQWALPGAAAWQPVGGGTRTLTPASPRVDRNAS